MEAGKRREEGKGATIFGKYTFISPVIVALCPLLLLANVPNPLQCTPATFTTRQLRIQSSDT